MTYLVLATCTGLTCYVAMRLTSELRFPGQLSIGLAYTSFALLTITLAIGPWRLLTQHRRSPLNIDVRRDIGIWAGLTGIGHILFTFVGHYGKFWSFFFEPDGSLVLNLFGVSNHLGAAATILLALLLGVSNDCSLRWLKGARWKRVQRLNYLLFILAVAHTLGYQVVLKRIQPVIVMTLAATAAVVALRALGFSRSRWMKGVRRATPY